MKEWERARDELRKTEDAARSTQARADMLTLNCRDLQDYITELVEAIALIPYKGPDVDQPA